MVLGSHWRQTWCNAPDTPNLNVCARMTHFTLFIYQTHPTWLSHSATSEWDLKLMRSGLFITQSYCLTSEDLESWDTLIVFLSETAAWMLFKIPPAGLPQKKNSHTGLYFLPSSIHFVLLRAFSRRLSIWTSLRSGWATDSFLPSWELHSLSTA